ncbi:MAG: substrate-binding domain-containing protein [Fimbriimonas sp.]
MAQRLVRTLCDEGLLYPVHGMGTFAGRRPMLAKDVFLFLNDGVHRSNIIRHGFEERISGLGAISISLPIDEAFRAWDEGLLPDIQGIWDPSFDFERLVHTGPQVPSPSVALRGRADPNRDDTVSFDDFDGGRRATEHLMSFGMRSGVFVGIHGPDVPRGAIDWSGQRAEGFLAAMQSIGRAQAATCLVPSRVIPGADPGDPYDYFAVGFQLAREIENFTADSGIVAANDQLAYGFIAGLLAQGLAPEDIPATIGFDNRETRVGNHMSSMSLPWHDLGQLAAELLFRRASGSLTGPLVTETLPMIPIMRISSVPGWLPKAPLLLEALRRAEPEHHLF